MSTIVILLSLFLLGLIGAGFYLDRNPPPPGAAKRWSGPILGGNVVLFLVAQVGVAVLGMQDALAATQAVATEPGTDVSLGTALAIIGIGLPTAASTIAAALAVGPIGAASLAAVAEKPEIFGRTLVYLGLAEGIAIYGLVLSILLLDKI